MTDPGQPTPQPPPPPPAPGPAQPVPAAQPVQPAQPAAPVPGWYTDAHGLLRWWDGAGWTEHIQMPGQMPPLTPSSSTAVERSPSGFGERSFVPWIIAMVAALALIGASVIILGNLGDDDGTDTNAIPSEEVQNVQSSLRTAQTTIETYSLDNNGSYTGATAEGLTALEPTLSGVPLTVNGQSTTYALSATAGDVTFTITKAADGVVTFTCTPPGGSGCDDTGSWGLAA